MAEEALAPIDTSSTKTEELDVEMLKKEANTKFLQGKRLYIIRDYSAAVTSFVESCELMSKIYGEHADELADPYFYYGKALFELARSESQVLGDQMEQPAEDEDDEEEGEGEEEDAAAGEENGREGEKENGEKEAGEEKENGEAKDGDDKENGTTNGDVQEAGGGEEDPEANGDDVNDLQLSWELLELAKSIYKRKADECKETAIKLSEVYLSLGENGLESESYTTAIDDIRSCLELQRKHLSADDRRIAETYYQLGVAHSLDKNFDESIECFKASIKQLEVRVKWLEDNRGEDVTKNEEEVKDIKSVINEIHEKISDMLDYKEQMREEILKQVAISSSSTAGGAGPSSAEPTAAAAATSSSSTTESKPVTDISHLIKKKRKADTEDPVADANVDKKTKCDEN